MNGWAKRQTQVLIVRVEGVVPTQEDSDAHGSGVVYFNLTQRDHRGDLLRHRKLSFSGCDICQAERAMSEVGLG